ncbi:family 43 glycosylhydrolase [Sphingobacterium thalpophilum]|uniref:Arabinoxylan arabinofuranohydrolase n=1 Tax=Sphingobacterium thalpophilum TaxID=259 RepID=A0A4U9W821_9SPHI|nr:family 43 glycosylhydrolase [Sphingobacterium thalpophilum]VTR55021.1 Arabinoxylan arabinofuranohydrolase precursor [Sphingobacterium thalpophilum]
MKKNKIISFVTLLLLHVSHYICAQVYHNGPVEKDFAGYLFAYFKGNAVQDEAVCFAISTDGYTYRALNGNRPVLDSKLISKTGGVRDPHVLRGVDGRTFYMVLTDMTSSKGWDSNRGMVLLKSQDLLHWSYSKIDIQQRFAGQESLKRVWAPQTIFDAEAKKYLVYWSMKHGDGPDIIYYAYANPDFTDFETEPRVLFTPRNGLSCIDGDIIEKNGLFYLFYKTEGHGNGIKVAITDGLTSGKWVEQPGYKQQTKDAVEGSSVFKRNQSSQYVLMYDVYGKGKYQFCVSDDLDRFKVIDHEIDMDFHPRHGTIIPITRQELAVLTANWGVPQDITIGLKKNPVLNGFYADPDVLYSHKTKKYYIYPTSDGFDGWGGFYFKTFSSTDLENWKDEGVILDLKKDVPWGPRNAWAPSIVEKKKGNDYKYYYYFTAAQKIGVAVADLPTGPFKDSGKPLIDFKPAGVKGGQEIDPAVFHDPKSGKSYLYWGNGYLAVAELDRDMVSIKKNTVKVLTPDKTFREGAYVIYRNGLYYFFWSENDTRNEDYRVRYGTSTSPYGPITVPENNLILQKDISKGIYGTGHNSVLQVPGKDEWYIVYHRFSYPDGIGMGDAAGFHREVCIDRLYFDKQGNILPVEPSN